MCLKICFLGNINILFQRLSDINDMSRNTNFIKKANPLATVINKQSQPALRTRNNTTNIISNNSQQDINTKLYTFCETQNKPTQNNQNKPDNRERKVSLNNNLRTQNQTKSISKLGQMIVVNKDKSNKNTMSLANISPVNANFDRRKTQKSSSARFQDKKVNISISINPRTMRELQNSQEKYDQNQKRANEKPEKNWWELKREQKKQNSLFVKQKQIAPFEQKRKIVIQEQQLQKFTKKFAHQKCALEQKIAKYESKLMQSQQSKKQWLTERKDMSEYIFYLQEEKSKWQEEISTLKATINALKHDNQYYIIAKDEARNAIKEQEVQIATLYEEIQQLKKEMRLNKQSSFSEGDRRDDIQKELGNKLSLMEIENQHLFNEKQILQRENSLLLHSQSFLQQRIMVEDKIRILMQRNNQLKSDLKQALLGQISADVYTKTIQDLSESIVRLKEENKSLKNRWETDACSIRHTTEQSRFEFKLQSTDKKKEDNSPSEVQFVWRRQNSSQTGRELSSQQIALFEVGLFPRNQIIRTSTARNLEL